MVAVAPAACSAWAGCGAGLCVALTGGAQRSGSVGRHAGAGRRALVCSPARRGFSSHAAPASPPRSPTPPSPPPAAQVLRGAAAEGHGRGDGRRRPLPPSQHRHAAAQVLQPPVSGAVAAAATRTATCVASQPGAMSGGSGWLGSRRSCTSRVPSTARPPPPNPSLPAPCLVQLPVPGRGAGAALHHGRPPGGERGWAALGAASPVGQAAAKLEGREAPGCALAMGRFVLSPALPALPTSHLPGPVTCPPTFRPPPHPPAGKMVLLDKLLPKLQSRGSRVLIFSQVAGAPGRLVGSRQLGRRQSAGRPSAGPPLRCTWWSKIGWARARIWRFVRPGRWVQPLHSCSTAFHPPTHTHTQMTRMIDILEDYCLYRNFGAPRPGLGFAAVSMLPLLLLACDVESAGLLPLAVAADGCAAPRPPDALALPGCRQQQAALGAASPPPRPAPVLIPGAPSQSPTPQATAASTATPRARTASPRSTTTTG